MKKTKIIQVKKQEIIYKFYCDMCNKHIGDSIQYEDGYYEELGVYEQEFNVKSFGWCTLKMHLCDKCKVYKTHNILLILKKLGFKHQTFTGCKDIEVENETQENE